MDEETVTYHRVQGGEGDKRSWERIKVDDEGNVTIERETLNVSAGDASHAEYFLSRRPGGYLVSFKVPRWLDDMIEEFAVPQKHYKSNPGNQGGLAPKIVDETTPGRSRELPSIWAEWLEEYAVPGSGRVVRHPVVEGGSK